MIGQADLIKVVTDQIDNGMFPRFSIFVGSWGSEKNEFAPLIADKLGCALVHVPDCKADTIKAITVESYKCATPTVYALYDVDEMSVQSKNALLKVTEEPPNKAYFVMTLCDLNNTLPTIQSRGSVYRLSPYKRDELVGYAEHCGLTDDLIRGCETPREIDALCLYGAKEFHTFVEKVVDNIATVSGSNAFKIAQSIKFKDSDESGYDLGIFWKGFCEVCVSRGFYRGFKVTSDYLKFMHSKSVNRAMLFDMWVLDIRKEWRDGCY